MTATRSGRPGSTVPGSTAETPPGAAAPGAATGVICLLISVSGCFARSARSSTVDAALAPSRPSMVTVVTPSLSVAVACTTGMMLLAPFSPLSRPASPGGSAPYGRSTR